MNYRLTCLTPTLVGDGQKLAPIDYMVWKDHVNVLNQKRIFRLLSKGPRLDGYLNQLKKSEKLDFASWGGFAQNYAGRRIPFEHASSTQFWERAHAENLFIPTFATGPRGPYLPGTAIKGAIRTAMLQGMLAGKQVGDFAARMNPEGKPARHPASAVEEATLGSAGSDSLRFLSTGDSQTIAESVFKVYLLRVSTLEARGGGKFELAWKQAPRGNSKRVEDSTPIFAEMAVPGTTFEGGWHESEFLAKSRRKANVDRSAVFGMVNAATRELLRIHSQYAVWTGLANLKASIARLDSKLSEVEQSKAGCVFPIGWGGSFFSKVAFLNTAEPAYREILKQVGFYARAIQTGLPFPKTRKIIFEANQPAALPGFVHLEIK